MTTVRECSVRKKKEIKTMLEQCLKDASTMHKIEYNCDTNHESIIFRSNSANSNTPNNQNREITVTNIPPSMTPFQVLKLVLIPAPIEWVSIRMQPDFEKPLGSAYAEYKTMEEAHLACRRLDSFVFQKKRLSVRMTHENTSVFVKAIDFVKTKEEICVELTRCGVLSFHDIYLFRAKDNSSNLVRCVLVYFNLHKDAASAKELMAQKSFRLFDCRIQVEWGGCLPDADLVENYQDTKTIIFLCGLPRHMTQSNFKQVIFGLVNRVLITSIVKSGPCGFINLICNTEAKRAMDTLRHYFYPKGVNVKWAKASRHVELDEFTATLIQTKDPPEYQITPPDE